MAGMGREGEQGAGGTSAGRFGTTSWTMVLAAGDSASPDSRAALETLCRQYWYPVYAYIRRRKYPPQDAEDLTQGFFVQLLERRSIAAADPERGKFRAYLLGALKHFLADERDRAAAVKRGAGRPTVSLDTNDAEVRYAVEPVDDLTPERLFERQWALIVLSSALADLRQQNQREGAAPLFERIKGCLAGEDLEGSYQQIGQELGISKASVGTAVYRLRREYAQLVRQQIAHTLEADQLIDEEVSYLFSALRG